MSEKIKAAEKNAEVGSRKMRSDKTSDADVGNALRSAYQKTVSEGVPDDLMDLLNRLD